MKDIQAYIEEQKRNKLIALGMYDTIEGTPEKPGEYEREGGSTYDIVPWKIADEEFQKLKLYNNRPNNAINAVSITCLIAAIIIYFFGFVSGVLVFDNRNVTPAIIYWVSAFIFGTVVLGLSEIIKLLHQIKYRMM